MSNPDPEKSWTAAPFCPQEFVERAFSNAAVVGGAAEFVEQSATEFRALVKPLMIEAVATYQGLRASIHTHHRENMGLLYHCGEVAMSMLQAFNARFKMPSGDTQSFEKRRHLAFQAFVLSCGLFHDVKRLFKHYRISSYVPRFGQIVEYDSDDDGNLYDWCLENSVEKYTVQPLNFRDLSCDLDSAMKKVTEVCEDHGIFDDYEIRSSVLDGKSAEWMAITELVVRADYQSVSEYRKRNPSKQLDSETFKAAMRRTFGSSLKWISEARVVDGQIFLNEKLLNELRLDTPMHDEIFDFWEQLNPNGPVIPSPPDW